MIMNAMYCADPPRDQCSFYTDCLEARYHCGSSGYPIGYGLTYCQMFSIERNKLSSRGQEWMLDTMQCLQRALIPEATGSITAAKSCETLNDKAFASHPACYVNDGVCTLPLTDWIAIVEIVQIPTLFGSWEASLATVETGGGCAEFYAFLITQIHILF
ncbi:hypothetical protein BDQ12DRAFT_699122 [Crucibulum laeve]|uniref:Uncharacterized protein n=1 Tax=Crucibulum laeve TaxID=68775 RepID=A0A5C3LWP5_9AGAR|nr:hypothetical protein BDQ12DRAFT_699122 [Crucibulum laeve]